MSDRIIAIGDVHGCHDELSRLLETLSLTDTDTVVMLGDIINRGPDSHKTLQICREIGAVSIVGNHERRMLRSRSGKRWRKLNAGDLQTYKSLDATDWEYLEKMRTFVHYPEIDTVLVHGGFLPGEPWQEQGRNIVTQIQVIDPKGRARKRSDAPPGSPHWSDKWHDSPFVVYGHTPWHEVRRTEWTMGIDTGCVYGGYLSAVILPERTVVQVRAAQAYYPSPMSWTPQVAVDPITALKH